MAPILDTITESARCDLRRKNKWASQQMDKKFKNKHRNQRREKRKNIHANRRGVFKQHCITDVCDYEQSTAESSCLTARASSDSKASSSTSSTKKHSCSPSVAPSDSTACPTLSSTCCITSSDSVVLPGVVILPNRFKPEDYKQFSCFDHETCTPQQAAHQKRMCPLTSRQRAALAKVKTESMQESQRCRKSLETRLEKLGFNKRDVWHLLSFMQRRVPVTMRVPVRVIRDHLITDGYLRNLFETGTSGGSTNEEARQGWEKRMFGMAYENGPVTERPKYGCLNMSLVPQGCDRSTQYGECYFVMKDETCRWRTTFSNTDSSVSDAIIGVFAHCCHVLNAFFDDDLKHLVQVARKDALESNDKVAGTQGDYREVQIHGDVRTDRDVKQLWVRKRFEKDEKVLEFVQKNRIELKVFDG